MIITLPDPRTCMPRFLNRLRRLKSFVDGEARGVRGLLRRIRGERPITTTTRRPFASETVEPQCADGPAARYPHRRFGKTSEPPVVMGTRKGAR
jgi:hypothetical protein